jgi:hypothetical protein
MISGNLWRSKMGGYGSGRRYGAANCTDEFRTLDVRRWRRDGLLSPGNWFRWQWSREGETVASIQVRVEEGRVLLVYRHRDRGGEWQDTEYPVWLDWTACNYGGERVWFRCPARNCGRRVALLYGGTFFAYRRCYGLAYPSQRDSAEDRAMRRADNIRERLGWHRGILNPPEGKPKGMRWRTYWRLVDEHDTFAAESLAMAARRFGIMF